MRILYVSHYFPPEMGAPAGRVAGLSRQWVRAGHHVDVLTGFPHHPTGIVPPEYRRAFRRGFLREDFHGVAVHRCWIFPAANRGKLLRSLNYASFLVSAALHGSLRLSRPDVVVATSPQLLCAAAGAILARRFRAPLVMEVRDLWPESLVAVRASSHRSPLVFTLETLARRLYRSADHLVTVTDAQRRAIISGGIPESCVTVVPNGVDAEFLEAGELSPASPGAFFTATYIGTLGMAHHLETLLEAAALLRGDSQFRFRLVGEGARRSALEARARELRLSNVQFTGERPRGEVPGWISSSHACLVLLRKSEVFRTVVPSKMMEVMAVGRPIVLGVEGEARELLDLAGAGVAIPPEDPAALAAALRALRDDPAHCRALGENGRRFVRKEFQRSVLAARYLELFNTLVAVPGEDRFPLPCPESDPLSEPR